MNRCVTVDCVQCGKPQTLEVKDKDFDRWLNGEDYIQNIFPYLSAGQREMLISKICPTCWDEMFKDDDE